MQRIRDRAPRLDPLGIGGVRREPPLDIDAAFSRQFIADIGMQFVFSYRNISVNHVSAQSRSASARSIKACPLQFLPSEETEKTRRDANPRIVHITSF
ncbi:hypothetical protein [Bradyrhizobium sp.]|uniref:hypothetical protein n=1 Tax=Bradyrhizobium sp. TaxID=376 RepID=UPI002615DC0A|nr:hypothetical protein [Bradyrhizobium sp.]